MYTKVKALKERFRNADAAEIGEIDKEMEALSQQDPVTFSKALITAVQETVEEANQYKLKERLKVVLPAISVSYLAKTYYGKTPQWFYQRLNENNVNGKPATFTKEELKILSEALRDIGAALNSTASDI